MASTLVWTSVCTDCFEKYSRKKLKDKAVLLLNSICLEPSSHQNSVKVRVHLTKDGILEPEIRPTPRVSFKGEFVLCTAEREEREEVHPPSLFKGKSILECRKISR